MVINSKVIIIGDTHFGVKKFSLDFLSNQIKFFNNQVFPYMKDNNIKYIFQLGDLFDNRTTADIAWLQKLRTDFFDELVKNDIILVSLKGNHDIYFRESLEVSLIDFFADLYPNNFKLFSEKSYIEINGFKTYIVPWLVKGESLNSEELGGVHTILGHFEIRDFQMVRGHVDTSSELTKEYFSNNKVQNVFSGHYHIKDTSSFVKYLGTPFQLNWSDYLEEKGFYVWDNLDTLTFIENTSSKKFVKVKYNDSKDPLNSIEISGLKSKSIFCNEETLKEYLEELEKHEVKIFINESKDRKHDEVLYIMKDIKSTIIDNQEISKIIGTNYIQNTKLDDSRTLITNLLKENREDLMPLLNSLLVEIDSKKKE